MSESDPLLRGESVQEVQETTAISIQAGQSWQRWLLLFIFCTLAFLQSSIFLAWNPIANSALFAFGPEWTPSVLAWQINLATITSPVIQYPVWKALEKYDFSRTIRWGAVFPLVISSSLNALPLVIDMSSLSYKWCTYGSFFCTGLTGVVFFSCVTRFSSIWFPPGERATATGLSCMMANLGGLLPAIIGPQLVTDPFKDETASQTTIAHQIYMYMTMYVVLSLILFLVFLTYFPNNNNDDVDEETRNIEQESVGHSIKTVLSSWNVIVVVLVASLGSIPHIWGSTLLTVTLARLKITQSFVGVTTTLSLVASTIFTLTLTRMADVYFSQNLKLLIMSMLPIHSLCMIGMSVIILLGQSDEAFHYAIGAFYIIAIGVLNSVSPLILELASELTYPVSEEIIAGVINQANNFFGVIFYLMFSYLPNVGDQAQWLLYLLMTLPVATLIMFAFVKDFYNRRQEVTTTL